MDLYEGTRFQHAAGPPERASTSQAVDLLRTRHRPSQQWMRVHTYMHSGHVWRWRTLESYACIQPLKAYQRCAPLRMPVTWLMDHRWRGGKMRVWRLCGLYYANGDSSAKRRGCTAFEKRVHVVADKFLELADAVWVQGLWYIRECTLHPRTHECLRSGAQDLRCAHALTC